MKVKTNQSVIDVSFDVCGSLAGYPTLLSQLPIGDRIGFDDMPDLLDVADIGQTWTPELENIDIDVNIKIFNGKALEKAPYSTQLNFLANAIAWGEAILPTLFDYTGWLVYEYFPDVVPEESKYGVDINQTAIDVTFDLAGSITGFVPLLNQLPKGLRVGFDDMPQTWEDIAQLGQTWTPEMQSQAFELSLKVYNIAAVQKRKYNTDINGIAPAITWGVNFLSGVVTSGDYLIDDVYNFLVDDNDNYITT